MTYPDVPEAQFIATQSPMSSTTDDFWQMVADEKVSAIVMLCDDCKPYWNGSSGGVEREIGVRVEVQKSYKTDWHFIYRLIAVNGTWAVHHFQYVGWPDHGIPHDMGIFLDFIQHVSSFREEHANNSVVVHCRCV